MTPRKLKARQTALDKALNEAIKARETKNWLVSFGYSK